VKPYLCDPHWEAELHTQLGAHGLTSRFVLEALQRNDGDHLWSIDVPPLLQPELH
jgi:hypothetical protein